MPEEARPPHHAGLCPECRPGQPHVATLSGRTLEAIRVLSSPGAAWRDLDPSPKTLAPVRTTVGNVISHLLGRRPRRRMVVLALVTRHLLALIGDALLHLGLGIGFGAVAQKALETAPSNCRLLDVGCGTGVFLQAAIAAGIDGYGIDAAPEMIDVARQRLGDDRVRVQRMQDVSEIESYDVICALSWTLKTPSP